MSDFKVTPLPTELMLQRQEIDQIIGDLKKRQKGLRALVVAYVDEDGSTFTAISDSTTIGQLCFFNSVFTADIVRYLGR